MTSVFLYDIIKVQKEREVTDMIPTDKEVVFWIVAAVIAWLPFLIALLPINWGKKKKDDPYRYCPKEDEY